MILNMDAISDCCWSRVIDYWNTWEGICSDCKEHCTSIYEEEKQFNESNFDYANDFYEQLELEEQLEKKAKLKQYNKNEPWLDEERLRVLLLD